MIPTLCRAKQPTREAWSLERLVHERSINLGLSLERSTNHTYSSALNSYLTFCDLHHFPIEPTANTFSYFITFMATHINPRSVDNYLSGICSQLEEYYPSVRDVRKTRLVARTLRGAKRRYGTPIKRKLPLTRADLARVVDSFPDPSHDDKLFLSILLDGFHGLLRLGELVWPDNPQLQLRQKLSLRTSVCTSQTNHSFVLQMHKVDPQFEGATIVIQRSLIHPDPHKIFLDYLTSRDSLFPFHSTLWLRSTGAVPTRAWFLTRLRKFFPPSIAGHSLRSGGATSLAAAGVPASEIQAIGRWSSDSFRSYIRKNQTLLIAIVFNGRSAHDGRDPFALVH